MVQSIKKIGLIVLLTMVSIIAVKAQTAISIDKKQITSSLSKKKCPICGKKSNSTACKKACSKPHKSTSTTMELKDHVCTEACHNTSKCVLAHGEKGHICDEKCKKK